MAVPKRKTSRSKRDMRRSHDSIKNINIALDKDARAKALQSCEYFINNGVKVTLIDLKEEDPSDLGFSKITTLIQSSKQLTTYQLMEMKIKEKMI